MVTEQEMRNKSYNSTNEKDVYKVSIQAMGDYDYNKILLADKIGERKKQYEREHKVGYTDSYLDMSDDCQIAADTLKKAISGTNPYSMSRTNLYKFVVGLHMDLAEANEYFEMCGGPLRDTDAADYVCLCAIRDRDSIESLIEEFKKYLGKNIGLKQR